MGLGGLSRPGNSMSEPCGEKNESWLAGRRHQRESRRVNAVHGLDDRVYKVRVRVRQRDL
jgi:hypothetical protein